MDRKTKEAALVEAINRFISSDEEFQINRAANITWMVDSLFMIMSRFDFSKKERNFFKGSGRAYTRSKINGLMSKLRELKSYLTEIER